MIHFLAVIGLTLVIFAMTLLFGLVVAYITDDDDIREYDQLTKNIRKIATVVGGGYGRIGVMENVNKRYESEKPFNKKE